MKRYGLFIEVIVEEPEALGRELAPGHSYRYGPDPGDVDCDPPYTVEDDLLLYLREQLTPEAWAKGGDPAFPHVGITLGTWDMMTVGRDREYSDYDYPTEVF